MTRDELEGRATSFEVRPSSSSRVWTAAKRATRQKISTRLLADWAEAHYEICCLLMFFSSSIKDKSMHLIVITDMSPLEPAPDDVLAIPRRCEHREELT